MNNAKRKIIGGTVFFGCAVFALAAASKISSNISGSVPVSMLSYDDDKPIIVLDAGHGEST